MTKRILALTLALSYFFLAKLTFAQVPGITVAPDFQAKHFVLSNGLQVLILPSNRAPIVTQMLLYRVGSADEEAGESGLAHFLEHLMFKATRNYPVGFYDQEIHRVGGQMNAFTTEDYTVYHQTVSSEFLELIMRLEADRMQNLIIEEPGFSAEKEVVREEIRQNHIDPPASQFYHMMRSVLFIHHPYGRPVIGWDHEVSKLTAQDALEFYRRWYSPNNAILMIIGDVKIDQVQTLVEKYYGPIQANPNLKPADRLIEPALNMPRRVEFASPKSQNFRWQRLYKIDFPQKKDSLPMEIMAEILGGNSNSRLYKRLVIQEKLASSAAASLDASNRDYATFGIYVTALSKEHYAAIEEIVNQEIENLQKQAVLPDEIERAKISFDNSTIKARDDLTNLGQYILMGLSIGWSLEDLQQWSALIRAVEADVIKQQAIQYLIPENAVTGTLSPQ